MLSARELFLARLQQRKAMATSTTATTTIGAMLSVREQFLAQLQQRKALASTKPPTTTTEIVKTVEAAPFPTEIVHQIGLSRHPAPTRRSNKLRTFPTFSTIVVPNDEDDDVIKALICKFNNYESQSHCDTER